MNSSRVLHKSSSVTGCSVIPEAPRDFVRNIQAGGRLDFGRGTVVAEDVDDEGSSHGPVDPFVWEKTARTL